MEPRILDWAYDTKRRYYVTIVGGPYTLAKAKCVECGHSRAKDTVYTIITNDHGDIRPLGTVWAKNLVVGAPWDSQADPHNDGLLEREWLEANPQPTPGTH